MAHPGVFRGCGEAVYKDGVFMVGTVAVELGHLPVVTLTERGDQASVRDFLAAFERLLATQKERFVSLHDVRGVHGWDVPERKVVHAWLHEHAAVLTKLVLGHATIVNGIKQRTMAGMVFWGTRFEQNVTCFEALEPALDWAQTLARTGRRR